MITQEICGWCGQERRNTMDVS